MRGGAARRNAAWTAAISRPGQPPRFSVIRSLVGKKPRLVADLIVADLKSRRSSEERLKRARVAGKKYGKDSDMTRSVEELRLEAERNRAGLAATVDQLRERVSDAADGIRQKVSPEYVKSELSDYISLKAYGWGETLKQRAIDNPMGTVAAGAVAAISLMRMARGLPLPLLMLGAGAFMTSKTARDRAAQGAASVKEKAGEMLVEAGNSPLVADVKDRLAAARTQATETADDLKIRATQVASDWSDKIASGGDTLRNKTGAAKDAVATQWSTARQRSGDAALIGGLGVAIGAIIAASLPETRAEAKAMGEASNKVKRKAGEAMQSGFATAKSAAASALDAAAKTVGESDLGGEVSRMTQNMSDTLKEGADDVVRAAVRQ